MSVLSLSPATPAETRGRVPTPAFDALVDRLRGPLEAFRYPVKALQERYGEAFLYEADRLTTLVDRFAALHGESLGAVLEAYGEHAAETADARRHYREGGGTYAKPFAEVAEALSGPAFRRRYLCFLALSSVLNRSRFELLTDFREQAAAQVPRGRRILEVGAGNCLDACFLSGLGPVEAYEPNPLSRQWLDLQRPLPEGREVRLRHELYGFDQPERFGFVALVELLEHLEDPAAYLRGAHRVLAPDGKAFFTFALRMPQLDHLVELTTVDQCRELVAAADFEIHQERGLVDTLRPFAEGRRWSLTDDPETAAIYWCIASPRRRPAAGALLADFNEDEL